MRYVCAIHHPVMIAVACFALTGLVHHEHVDPVSSPKIGLQVL